MSATVVAEQPHRLRQEDSPRAGGTGAEAAAQLPQVLTSFSTEHDGMARPEPADDARAPGDEATQTPQPAHVHTWGAAPCTLFSWEIPAGQLGAQGWPEGEPAS